ncbi:MAG: rRNA maturation RNase YbeY [Acidimicrobiales bacterium]
MSVEVFAADEQSDQPVDALRLVNLAKAVLGAQGAKPDSELSMLFVDEDAMAELNKRFLGKDGPTDVLAFPIDDDDVVEGGRSPDSLGPGSGADPDNAEPPNLLGDVVVCPAVAARNAPDHGGTYDDEMALLVVHGILHILGMDHVDDAEAEAMEQRERELLEQFHKP